MNAIQFPVGPIADRQTGQLSLEWSMFLRALNDGVFFAIQEAQRQAGFASTMLNMAEDDMGTDGLMALIPGPQGVTGAQGQAIPGMAGEDGTDEMPLLGWPNPAHSSFGEMTITGNVTATTLTLQNTYYKQTAGWVAGDLDDFTFSTDTLTATRWGNFETLCTFCTTCNTPNQIIRAAVFQNGSLITEHLTRFKLLAGTDEVSATLSGVIANVNIGDTFDLRFYNETSAGATVTISDANFSIFRI